MSSLGEESRPHKSEAGSVWICELNKFQPSSVELAIHGYDEITPAVLRLLSSFLGDGLDIVLLSRRNDVPWYVGYTDDKGRTEDGLKRYLAKIKRYLPDDDRKRVSASTAHSYKGQENQAVIILDAVGRSYPLIHPDWIFLRVFGDTIDRIAEEERRLFYVAITRAEKSLAFITEGGFESPYLDDVRRRSGSVTSIDWESLAPMPSLDAARLELRVSGNTFPIKDQLKNVGYHWHPTQKGVGYWRMHVMADGFSFEAALGQPWAGPDVRIEVFSEAGEGLQVSNGQGEGTR